MKIRRILCPTDFSEFSERALQHAIAHARWAEAELTLLHVNPFFLPTGGGAPYTPYTSYGVPADGATRAQLLDALKAEAQPAREAGLDPKLILSEGDPSDEILRLARTSATDLIVMGTHGLHGFDRWLLGSVASRVAHFARCALLTVPRPPEAARPGTGPLYERVLCAVDLSESQPLVEAALAIGHAAGAPVTVLHVLQDLSEHEAAARLARLDWPALERGLEAQARDRLADVVARCPADGTPVEQVVVSGRPYREILKRAGTSEATLVVIGIHGKNPLERLFFGSTALHVLRQAACPVLTVRLADRREKLIGPVVAVGGPAA
jgi:nucleotide-binding universal stress UspA family protein